MNEPMTFESAQRLRAEVEAGIYAVPSYLADSANSEKASQVQAVYTKEAARRQFPDMIGWPSKLVPQGE